VGWLLPVVTGIPFYIMGLALLGLASGRARQWINRMERALPEDLRWSLRRGLAKVRSKAVRDLVNPPPDGAGGP
jgi:uncharacterized membrane protein YbaN (DUF454 family)